MFGLGETLNRLHKLTSKVDLLVSIAIKLRNQCQAVVRISLQDGIFPHENGEEALLSIVASEARVFIDVGANVGSWSNAFSSHMKNPSCGLLFEPMPEAAAKLRELTKHFPFHAEVIEAAVSDKPGATAFYVEPGVGERSSVVKGVSGTEAKKITVAVTTIDDELSSRCIEFVDFMKIDAEGLDSKVIAGAFKSIEAGKIGCIQFEYNAPWAYAGSTLAGALRLLEDCDYRVYLIKSDGLYSLRYDLYGEYFGYSNFVAVSNKMQQAIAPLIRGRI